MTAAAPPSSAYHRVERLHLRQWAVRSAAPLAVLATNGAGWVDLPALPRHDAPAAALGLPGWTGAACVALGGVLVLAACVLRVLAKGVLVRRTTVTRGGIYSRVRHPFYLGTLLGGVGTLCLAGTLGAAVALGWLAVALPVFLVTVDGEETGLRAAHGDAWDRYAACVPRLVPGPSAGGAEPAPVTWANLVREGEPPRGLRFLAGACAVLAVRTAGAAGAALLAAAGLLFAASHVVRRAS